MASTADGGVRRIQLGAIFGQRAAVGAFTPYTLEQAGQGELRFLNDVHGLMVFESDARPTRFMRVPPVTPTVSDAHSKLETAMAHAIAGGGLSEERQVTYDLFAASFGQDSADARFALLMAALETMFDFQSRSREAIGHVEHLIELTQASGLPGDERKSMLTVLGFMHNKSIRQTGKQLAATLGDRTYKGLPPGKFFVEAYDVRSRLLHGRHPVPSRNEVDLWAAPMEVFVADLLTLHSR